jgi:hypothetical protein
MGAFTLTNGALLGGLALLAAPVIAHLLQRRARKPIVFPSIAFLQATAAQHSRLHKLRRLFLMLLRLLALACIVLAFTRPVWWSIGAKAGERKAASATVFVIDQSLSTGQRSHGGIVFDQFRAEVLRRLNELETGVDVAGLVWASDHSTAVFPRLTANLPALETEIASARPGEGRADFAAAMSLAARLFESHAGPKRLVLLTDRQASNWKSPDADIADLRTSAGVEVVIPEIGVATESNVSLSSPNMQPARPRPDAEVELTAAVRNHSESTRVVAVLAEWIGSASKPIASQSVSVSAGQSSAVTLQGTAPGGGPAVRWQIKDVDALEGDNSLWLTAEVGRGIPMVIASDDSPDDPGTAAFYLMRALAPFDEHSESQSSFAPRHVAASRLTAADLTDIRVLFLGYAGVLKQEAATALVQFVERGGALVILAGDGPADRNVEALNLASKGAMLPWSLLARADAPRRSPIVVDRGRWNSRWLREFDEPSQLALREIAFRRVWQAGTPATDAETLLSFAKGDPAAGLRHFGKGQCLLLNFSPESTTSDLGKTGTFVALIQMLTSQLAHDESKPSTFIVGNRLTFDVPKGTTGSLQVLGPDGGSSPAGLTAGTRELVGQRATRSGIHRLMSEGQEIAAVAVNVDPRESNLTPLTVDELQRLVSSAGTAPAPGTSTTFAAETHLDAGKPLWGGFLLTGLFAIATELFLLGLWRR